MALQKGIVSQPGSSGEQSGWTNPAPFVVDLSISGALFIPGAGFVRSNSINLRSLSRKAPEWFGTAAGYVLGISPGFIWL